MCLCMFMCMVCMFMCVHVYVIWNIRVLVCCFRNAAQTTFHFFKILTNKNPDEYKNIVRPLLKDLIADKDMEYVIVYIPSQGSFLQSFFFSCYDKLRTDHKDRVIKLNQTFKTRREDYVELVTKLKEGILQDFVIRCKRFEEEIENEDKRVKQPLWDYAKSLHMKEGLAFTLGQFGLHMHALLLYQRLIYFVNENKCKSVIVKNNLTRDQLTQSYLLTVSFEPFIGEKDYSIPKILDVNGKPYKDLIYKHQISEFDYNNYLFARQVNVRGHIFLMLNSNSCTYSCISL